MSGLEIRAFASGDLPGVLGVLREGMAADSISEQRFTRQVLLDANFRAAGAPVGLVSGEVVGFCLAVARQVPLENAPSDAERGYISLMGVGAKYQRQGIGTKLLARAEDYLRSQGRKMVMVSSYAPNYFIPGVDVRAYEPALNFFAKHGYQEVYRPLAMQTHLWSLQTPEWVVSKEKELGEQGVRVREFEPALVLPMLEFVQREFPGDWVRVVRETSVRILAGESPARLVAAVDAGGNVLAFSHFENERFGPIGVGASERGRGLGQVLMYRTLDAQRQAGFRAAWFLWSDDKTAKRIYSGAGFKEVRRFALLRKQLD
ncbi:MAG TPA: GNAT family N-acetyltransferase [Tepidisphaeraceae bacterium]